MYNRDIYVSGEVIIVKDIEKIIREVNGTMAIEGMPITKADEDRIRNCLRDNDKYEKTLRELVKKHTVIDNNICNK